MEAAAPSTQTDMDAARRVLALLDLTSLNDRDDAADIAALCKRAVTDHGPVAAVCVWPRFVTQANDALASTTVEVAAVANFPEGATDIDAAVEEARRIFFDGGDEVDLVFPYRAFMSGDVEIGDKMVRAVREACGVSGKLKVILETGELADPALIRQASDIALGAGADFIKTSTGKVPVNATLEAAEIMMTAIRDVTNEGRRPGFKAAGGIRDVPTAMQYLALADDIMGPDWAGPKTFRFGASGLLGDILQRLQGGGGADAGASSDASGGY